MERIINLQKKFTKDLASSVSVSDLESLHVKYLGRNGQINELFATIKKVEPANRKEFGIKLNHLKRSIDHLMTQKMEETIKSSKSESIDMTLPGKKYPKGSLHLVSYATEEICRIFERLGFIRMSYPEVEWDIYAFDALNMPKNHPARDEFESMFIHDDGNSKKKLVLSPHTSSGQVREMLRVGKPPIRMINIAKCYRRNWDVSHSPMFFQFEGLCVDRGINITHLKGAIEYFAKEFFGHERKIRLRPFHFMFTEPSFEVDITCGLCSGKGILNGLKCKLCKSGWLELGGSGMVHPNVLRNGKIDPSEYTGWAFGFGVERVIMMKEGMKVDDIRILYSGDIRFLEQF